MKIQSKTYDLIFAAVVSVVMSFFMAFFMLLVNVGFVEGFLLLWLKSFGIGIVISLPVSIVFIPMIAKWLSKTFKVY